MASAAPKGETSDVFNCSICLEQFIKPKYLPCLHTFCEACLNTYIISTQSGKDKPTYFPCPICRKEVKSHDQEAPIEEWAKQMPINHMINSLMESSVIGKYDKEIKCSPCERAEESATAKFWCPDCQESLCESCKKAHNRLKMSFKHKVIPVSDIKTSEMPIHIADIEEPCPIHKGELLKVYCQDHQEMCCVICISFKHRRCDEIKTFDQMAESIGDGNVQVLNRFKGVGKRLQSLIDSKQKNIGTIETQKQKITKEASTFVEQAKNSLDECFQEFKLRFSEIHKEQSTKLADVKDQAESFQETLLNCDKMLKAVLEHGSPKQIFISSEKIKKQLKSQSDALKKVLKDDQDIEYSFNTDGQLSAISAVDILLGLRVKKKPCDEFSPLEMDTLFPTVNKDTDLQTQIKMATVDHLKTVKLWDIDGGGFFSGGTFLNDGRLLCTDSKKKSLSVFNEGGIEQIHHPLDYQPWDVAQHSDGTIFVTDVTTMGIRSYTLSNETFIQLRPVVQLQSKPFGIEIINDHIVVVTKGHVFIMTQEGKFVKQFIAANFNTFNPFIAKPQLQGKETSFYCSYGKYVILQTVDGRVIQRYGLDVPPRGTALDCAANVYVCSWLSNDVRVVSKDFQSSCILDLDKTKIRQPYVLGFDKSGTIFFVSGHANGVLALFKLCLK